MRHIIYFIYLFYMKRTTTDRWAIVLAILILALLWFLYWRSWISTQDATAPSWIVLNADTEDAPTAEATDLPDWYTYLQNNDYTNTTSVEDFGGDEIITRATSTPFLARYWYISNLEEKSSTEDCSFPDIANKLEDLQKTIIVACAYDLLRWSNGDFIPDRVMTNQELLTVLVRTKTWFLAEDADPWFKNYFDWAQNNWLVDEGTSINDFSGDVTKATLWQRLYKLSLLD